MPENSTVSVDGWLEALASVEQERRTYRAKAEIFSQLRNVVKAAAFVVRADESAQELAELRQEAIAAGVPSEAIAEEIVEAWATVNLDGGPHRLWEWDAERDLPVSLAEGD